MAKSPDIDKGAGTNSDVGVARRLAYYLLPAGLAFLVGCLRLALPSIISQDISLLLLMLGVLLSVRAGGVGPGIFGTVLGGILEWRLSPSSGVLLPLVFGAGGVAVSLLTLPLQRGIRLALDRQRSQMLEALPTFAVILSRDGVVEEVNRTALETASLSRKDVVGKPFHEAYWWSHSEELQRRLQAALERCADGEPAHLEATLRLGADRFMPVEITFSIRAGLALVSAQDISRRIAAQREKDDLRERAERSEIVLRSAHQAAGAAGFDWLVQENELAWSDALRAVFELERDGQPEDWRLLVVPEDRDYVEKEIRRLLNQRAREYRLEFRVTSQAGGVRSLLSEGAIIYLPDKRQRMLGVVVDLTRAKQLEAAVRDSEERYRLLMENLPQIVFTARSDGRWDYVSPVWTRYTGDPAGQAIDHGWSSALHPDDVQGVLYRWMDAVQTGKPFASEHRIRSAGGEYRWFFVRAAPVSGEGGRVIHWFGAATDIDDQKRLEFVTRSREEWYQRTHEASAIGSFEWDLDSGRLRCSDEWLRLHRIQPTPVLLFEEWINSICREDRDRVRQDLQCCCAESGRRDFEYRVEAPDAPVRWINTRVTAHVDEQGNPRRVMGASMDATERKELEDTLRSKQRLESMGMLAGGIAHDFNNLLTAIMGNSSLLLERLSSISPSIEDILRATRRATDLTRQMLAFAGKGGLQTEPVKLSDLAKEAVGSLDSSLRKNIHIELEAAANLPAIDADPDQVRLVLMTLINNAVEAIGENDQGTVSIATFVHQMNTEKVNIAPGVYVALEVRDTGCGMDEATRARVFDPFFTTKFDGRGLGLSAALGIVRGHKGTISVYSVPGQGSTFTVLFPAYPEGLVRQPPPAPPERLDTSGKILVIDDEQILRNLAKTVLERCGYSVLLAEDGAKGIAQFAQSPGEVVLVILDFAMPGLSSVETLQRLRAIRPELKVMLTSGYSEDLLRGFEGKGLAGFLPKPFTAQALVDKVKAAIHAGLASAGAPSSLMIAPPNDTAHPS